LEFTHQQFRTFTYEKAPKKSETTTPILAARGPFGETRGISPSKNVWAKSSDEARTQSDLPFGSREVRTADRMYPQ
jgi:hypothetical protein